MPSPLYHGIGDPFVITRNAPASAGQSIIFPLELFSFDFSTDSTALEAKSQKKGIIRTIASAVGESTGTLTLQSQFGNFDNLAFFNNQLPKTVTSVAIPVLKSAVVPDTHEITDAGITTATEDGIYVYLNDDASSRYLKKVETAPATASEVQLNTTTHKLIFHADLEGKSITYCLPVTETNVKRIGGAIGDRYGDLEFWGTVYGTEDRIHFPSISFKTTPSLSLTGGDVATLEVQFSANVVPGDDEPFRLYAA